MASISNDPGGKRRILFTLPNGDRKAIRLGKVSQRIAEGIKYRVEQLIEALHYKHPVEGELAKWVANLEPTLAQKLARVGLITAPACTAGLSLGEHLTNYFAKRADVKASTRTNWRHTKRCLLKFFGADKPLKSFTHGDAVDFERWLKSGECRTNRYADAKAEEGLAINTVRKRIGNAKQFFQDAVSRDILTKNPFDGLKGTVGSNRERDFFVDRDMTAKVLDACPDAEWRLILALARFGGCRCPSEIAELKWEDINWANERMLVHASKTEHHLNKATRWVPLFPELKPYLEAVWEQAEPGAVHVISRDRRRLNTNPGTRLRRIVLRAGLKPWPKLFQNLRAIRATELANEYPPHVAAEWLGHSTLVANKHYWQVTEADYLWATGRLEVDGAKSGARVAQKAAQSVHAGHRGDSHKMMRAHEKTPDLRVNATDREPLQKWGDGRCRTRTCDLLGVNQTL